VFALTTRHSEHKRLLQMRERERYIQHGIVQLKGNVEEDLASFQQFGPVDAYIDISLRPANTSTHIRSSLMAFKPFEMASLMGTISKDMAVPYVMAELNNFTIRGQYMYEREDA